MTNALLFKPFLVSLLVAFLSTPLVIVLSRKLNWLEDAQQRSLSYSNVTHQGALPRGGGIGIFLAIVVGVSMFLPINPQVQAIFLATLLTVTVGVIDGIKDIKPVIRLLTNALAAMIIIRSGITINFITNPLGGIINLNQTIGPFQFSQLLTLFWITWSMNFVGWSAGVAGQLPGFVAITSLVVGALSLRFVSGDINQWPVIVLAGSLAGAYLGFLPFNFYRQKIMPGYSAKSLAGLLLATLAILSGAKLATVILTLAVPTTDAIWAIVRRLKNRQSPFKADSEHLHHLLLKVGVPQPLVAVIYWSFSAILGLIVLQLNSQQKVWAIVMVGGGVMFLILGLKNIIKRKDQSSLSA
ncbi:MAG: MraY family glycosyltransferase [Patescibacteria group bacterium]